MENHSVSVSDDAGEPDEPLSPELVLVLPPEERAAAIASLGPPVWPKAVFRLAPLPAQAAAAEEPAVEEDEEEESFAHAVASLVAARLVSLTLLFVMVTALTLILSLVASATR